MIRKKKKRYLLNIHRTSRGLGSCEQQRPCSGQDTGCDHDLTSCGHLRARRAAAVSHVQPVLAWAHLQGLFMPWEKGNRFRE